jgi:hypothetical protein
MHPQITPDRTRPRVEHLDDLKVLAIVGVIVVHTAITFGSTGDWYLAGLDEHLTRVGDVALSVCVIAGALVGMGLLFLIAGVLTPPALARKGPRRFARDRLLRLGLPLVLFVLLVSPPLEYVKYVTDGGSGGLRGFLHGSSWVGAPGPLWFVEALLAFSLAYAGLTAAATRLVGRSQRRRAAGRVALGVGPVAAVVLAIAATSFVVRLRFPLASEQFHLQLSLFPQYAMLFSFGTVAARHGWLQERSRRRERVTGGATVAAVVLLAAILAASGGLDDGSPVLGGLHWQAFVLTADEGALATCASLWALERARRRRSKGRPIAVAAARAAYGAYIAHAPLIVVLALAIHRLPAPAEVKFLLAAPIGVAASFGLASVASQMVLKTRVRRTTNAVSADTVVAIG